MLKFSHHIYKNLGLKIGIVFIGIFCALYLLFIPYTLSSMLWFEIAGVLLIGYGAIFVVLHFFYKKIDKDLSKIVHYLEKIDEKEYDAKLKIKHHLEFLHISVLLKNLVKRLHNKDKKSSKK